MIKFLSYTVLTVLAVNLLATSGDITLTWTSPIFPKLKSNDSDVNPFARPITEAKESWIGSLITIGAMIGPLPFGYISEKFGRKIALLAIAIPHIISYLTFAFSRTVHWYYFARFLGGVGVGGGYTLLPMYIAEIAEDSNRGMLSVTLNIFWNFGNLLSYVIGPYTSVLWFNIILACFPVSFFISFFFIAPETPHYLIGKNRIDEAEKSLMLLRNKNRKAVGIEIKHILSDLNSDEENRQFFDLFKSKVYLKALMISLVLVVAQQLSGIGAITFYTQEIFEDVGANGISADVSSVIIGMVMLISSVIIPFFADRAGRRLFLMLSCFGMSLSLLALGVYFYLKDQTDANVRSISWLPIVSLIFYIITFNLGISALPWTLSSELFPTCVKSYAASVVSFTCWIASFIITKFFNDMVGGLGHGGTFWLFGACCFVTGIFTLIVVPETKGKSFREIQEILK